MQPAGATENALLSPQPAPAADPWNEPFLRRYMPELDVLRGAAIFSVLAYHGLYWLGLGSKPQSLLYRVGQLSVFGWLGVNLFFILSGFLITGILLDSRDAPDYFRRFYLRRVLRILPAYLLTIAVLLLLHQMSWQYLLLSFLFLANFWEAFHVAPGYGPFWSLSVEEQFYLLWPTVVRRVSVRTLSMIIAAILLVEPCLRALTFFGKLPLTDPHANTFLIADNLAFGAAAAIFARSRGGTRRAAFRLGVLLMVLGLGLEAGGIPFGILHRNTAVGAVLQEEMPNIFFAGLLLWLLAVQSPLARGRAGAPLRFLGYISYGLYLVHVIVLAGYRDVVADQHMPAWLAHPWIRFFLGGGLCIVVAWISRRFFEERFLQMGRSARSPSPPATTK